MPFGWSFGENPLPVINHWVGYNTSAGRYELLKNNDIVDTVSESQEPNEDYYATPNLNILNSDHLVKPDLENGSITVEPAPVSLSSSFNFGFNNDGTLLYKQHGANSQVAIYDWPSGTEQTTVSYDYDMYPNGFGKANRMVYDGYGYYHASTAGGNPIKFRRINLDTGNTEILRTQKDQYYRTKNIVAHPFGYILSIPDSNTYETYVYNVENDSFSIVSAHPDSGQIQLHPNGFFTTSGFIEFDGTYNEYNYDRFSQPQLEASVWGAAYDVNGRNDEHSLNGVSPAEIPMNSDTPYPRLFLPQKSQLWNEYGDAKYMDKLKRAYDL